jgi:Fur family ferric uptake transcriptional regulator
VVLIANENSVSLSNSQAVALTGSAQGRAEKGYHRHSEAKDNALIIQSSRKTKQRDAVRAVLEGAERPLSVEELLKEASRRVKGLGVATVYRAVGMLLADGSIEAVEIPGEPARYERADKGHHHHFQCEKCDRAFDVPGCGDNLRRLAPPKFRVKQHSVTLYGLCAACAS